MEINFSKGRVYYERALGQGVVAAERTKPDVVYNVVSHTPPEGADEAENARMKETAQRNLNSVLMQLRRRGIPEDRIRVTNEPNNPDMPDGPVEDISKYSKISIFVK